MRTAAAEAISSAVLDDDPHSLPLGLSGGLARAASMELLPGEGARAWPARFRGSRDARRRPLGDGETGSGLCRGALCDRACFARDDSVLAM